MTPRALGCFGSLLVVVSIPVTIWLVLAAAYPTPQAFAGEGFFETGLWLALSAFGWLVILLVWLNVRNESALVKVIAAIEVGLAVTSGVALLAH